MKKPADTSVLVCSNLTGIARTLRMALRGMGVRSIPLAMDEAQTLEGFATAEPDCVVIYVDGPDATDHGLQMLKYIRRHEKSPRPQIPIVVVSPCRDLVTINAVVNGGAHEYVLFPTSGDILLKKIVAACTTQRPWIDRPDYFGPERRSDRETQPAAERRAVDAADIPAK